MTTETIRGRFDRRAGHGASRWGLVWPGVAGCPIWIFDGVYYFFFADHRFGIAPTAGMLLVPGLLCWAPCCMVIAMSERPSVRRPALLANGAFLIVTAAAIAIAAT